MKRPLPGPGCAHALTIVMLVAAIAHTSVAQTKPEPPRGRTVVLPVDSSGRGSEGDSPRVRVRYPEFDVPEYTITGDGSSGLQRAARPVSADHPGTGLMRSAGPGGRESGMTAGASRTPLFAGTDRSFTAGLRLRYGSFRSPGIDGWLGNDFGDLDLLLLSGFASSGGHVTNGDHQKAYNTLSAGFGVAGARVRARAGLAGNGYRLYGSPSPARWRTVTSFTGGLQVQSIRIGDTRLEAAMHVGSTVAQDSTKMREDHLGFELNHRGAFGPVVVRTEAELRSSSFSAARPSLNPFLTAVRTRARYELSGGLDMEGGLNGAVRRGSDAPTLAWLDPVFGVSWRGWTDITLFMRFEPSVRWLSLATLMEEIPYASLASAVRPARYPTDVAAGVEFLAAHNVRMSVTLRHLRGKDLPVVGDPDPAGLWVPRYDGVLQSTGLTAGIAVDFSPRDALHGSLTIRKSSWSPTGTPAPYYPDFETHLASSHRFPFGLTIHPSLTLAGGRIVDFGNTRTLPGFLDIGVRAEYIVVHSLTIGFALENLFGADRTVWEGYAGVPRSAELSLQYKW